MGQVIHIIISEYLSGLPSYNEAYIFLVVNVFGLENRISSLRLSPFTQRLFYSFFPNKDF